jgi:hypothetical protein
MRRYLIDPTPGRITHAILGPRHAPGRAQLTYLPPEHELTVNNLNRHGIRLN